MSIPVNLADGVQAVSQSLAVGGEPYHGEKNGRILLGRCCAANLEHLGSVS